MNRLLILLVFMVGMFGITACQSVKGYEKAQLNDPDMELGANDLDYFDSNTSTYREGASGGSGGKGGGGCGCN